MLVWEASLFLVVPFVTFYWAVELAFWSANVIKVCRHSLGAVRAGQEDLAACMHRCTAGAARQLAWPRGVAVSEFAHSRP